MAFRRACRWWARMGAALAVLLVASSCAASNSPSDSPRPQHPSVAAHANPRLPAYVAAEIKVAPQPNFAVGAFGSLWVTVGDGRVVRIDPQTNKVTQSIHVGGKPGPIIAGAGALWTGDSYAGRLVRIDPRTGRVVATVRIPGGVYGLASAFGSIWVSGQAWQGFVGVDPATDKVKRRGHAEGSDIAAGFGSLWVTDDNGVARLSPDDLSVQARMKTRASVHSLAVGGGGVWAGTGDAGDFVFHIDPRANKVAATIKTDQVSFPDRITFSKGTAWVGEFQAGTVLGIDPGTNRIIHRLKAGEGSAVVTVAFGSLWIDNYYGNSVWRIPLPVTG